MRPLSELLRDEPAWPLVEEWLAGAANPVRVVPADRARGEAALERLQVTTRSPLGSIVL